jgi:hypothetical protein
VFGHVDPCSTTSSTWWVRNYGLASPGHGSTAVLVVVWRMDPARPWTSMPVTEDPQNKAFLCVDSLHVG